MNKSSFSIFPDPSETRTRKAGRCKLLDAAHRVFLREGIGNTTMKMIAEECGMALRSVFNYYPNKDLLAVALQVHLLTQFNDTKILQYIHGDTALLKLRSLFDVITRLTDEQIHAMKFVTAFDYYYIKGYPSPEYAMVMQQRLGSFTPLIDLIKWGQAEGSIRNDLKQPAEIIYLTIFQVLNAYMQRYYYRKEAITEEGFPDAMGDPQLLVDVLIRGLAARPDAIPSR